jgi:ABC-type transport system involved in cytochrome bd biosynthesis fused ATPase/permease subunit
MRPLFQPILDGRRLRTLVLVVVTASSVILETINIGFFYLYLRFVLHNELPRFFENLPSFIPEGHELVILTLGVVAVNIVRFIVSLYTASFQSNEAYKYQALISDMIVKAYLHRERLERSISKSLFMRKLVSDCSSLAGGLYLPLMFLTTEILVSFALLTILFLIAPFVTVASFFSLLTLGFTSYWAVRGRLFDLGIRRNRFESERILELESAFEGIREIRFRGLQDKVAGLIDTAFREVCRVSAKQQVIGAIPRYALELLCYLAVVLFCAVIAASNTLDFFATAALFSMALLRMLPSVNRIINSMNQLRFQHPVLRELAEDMSVLGEVTSGKTNLHALSNEASIDLLIDVREVSVCTPHLNFNVPAFAVRRGDWVNLSGPSGAGKSYYLDLICENHPEYKEKFLWNSLALGKDLGKVYLLSQKSFIREGSVLDNITFGQQNFEKQNLYEILDTVDFRIRDTNMLSSLSIKNLSGGELQRICMARALLSRPIMLLLDEPTSALDSSASQELLKKLKNGYPDMAVVIISHHGNVRSLCNKVIEIKKVEL